MAPRIKKRGNLRIDAALDAMNPFGFPPKLVRDTVKELLDVYGGDDGWVFIEEGSYTLLIDTLLEKRKDGGIKVHEKGRVEDHRDTSIAGSSSNVADETSSSTPRAEFIVKKSDNVLLSSYMDNEALRIPTTLPRPKNDLDDDHYRSTFNSSSPADTLKISRRKPYHGWISSGDKEDLVYLTPGQLPEEFARLCMPHAQRKRKKRWDVAPAES